MSKVLQSYLILSVFLLSSSVSLKLSGDTFFPLCSDTRCCLTCTALLSAALSLSGRKGLSSTSTVPAAAASELPLVPYNNTLPHTQPCFSYSGFYNYNIFWTCLSQEKSGAVWCYRLSNIWFFTRSPLVSYPWNYVTIGILYHFMIDLFLWKYLSILKGTAPCREFMFSSLSTSCLYTWQFTPSFGFVCILPFPTSVSCLI